MLDIAFELIGEATSNSLLMFCFCNLIIVIILTGSSKPASMDSQDSLLSFNIASDDHDCADEDHEEEINLAAVSSAQEDESLIIDEDEDSESSYCCDEDNDDDDDDDDEEIEVEIEEEEEEEDDELRKRVEEFIAKINNEWRHDKLKALNLVY